MVAGDAHDGSQIQTAVWIVGRFIETRSFVTNA